MTLELTTHYKLAKVGAGQSFSENGYQFPTKDRDLIDLLLYKGAEGHRHDGASAATQAALSAPVLELDDTGGTLPAGVRIRYKYTYVDVNGLESAASPEAYIDTNASVGTPTAPALTLITTGGIFLPGNYFYKITAYVGTNTMETLPSPPGFFQITSGSTNLVRVTLPSLPAGATGFNIYRQKPGAADYFYVTSIVPDTTPDTFDDDGSIPEDCDRRVPRVNTTQAQNKVTVSLPGATPVVPVGYTWKLYRSFLPTYDTNSLAHWVVEETSEGSGIVTPTYEDDGTTSPSLGSPPTETTFIGSPAKIDLEDGAEVDGRLPPGLMAVPFEVTFSFVGQVAVMEGSDVWVCEYASAKILGVRASLGRGYVPASTDVIVDVNKGSGANPSYTTLFSTQSTRPRVGTGAQIGSVAVPQVTSMAVGDSLSIDVDQAGGGGTPTDYNLTVHIRGIGLMTSLESDGTDWS